MMPPSTPQCGRVSATLAIYLQVCGIPVCYFMWEALHTAVLSPLRTTLKNHADELWSKLLVSASVTPIVVPYTITYITPF